MSQKGSVVNARVHLGCNQNDRKTTRKKAKGTRTGDPPNLKTKKRQIEN